MKNYILEALLSDTSSFNKPTKEFKYLWVVYTNRKSCYNTDIPKANIFKTIKKAKKFMVENSDYIEEYRDPHGNWTKGPEKVKVYG